MDFMRLLKSLEELLYELVSWLIFYPLTFWRALTSPLDMMRYADVELEDRPEDQYEDTVSPPLFLLITLLISQALSSAFPTAAASREMTEALTHSSANFLIARGVIFGIFPMAMAVTLIRHKGVRLTRASLRPPFFSQCYVAGPFVFLTGLTVDFLMMPGGQGIVYGTLLFVGAILWYGQAQIRWFRRDLGIGIVRASLLFLTTFLLALCAALAVTLAVATQLPRWAA
ncbi:MAG: permease [Rhizobium sp.]|nr:permease [Rhizobium sp.]MCZ8350216.1 permease [Rhizobium sp.]